jgi:DNA-binding beta-propeller fold protein YncE
MNYPRSIAVDPATGDVWVPNYEGNPDLVVYDRNFNYLRRIDIPRFVGDIEIVGGVAHLVVRRTGSVMRVDTATGATLGSCCTGLGLLRGIAVDPVTGDYWLTSDVQPRVFVVRQDGTLVRQLSVDGRGWGVTIAGEVAYVADASANKIIAFDRATGTRLGTFGTAGSLPGQLRGPSGIVHDAGGDVYVVEERGGRVQVFGNDALPAPETVVPAVTWVGPVPTTGAPLPLVVRGRASDVSGVLRVEVLVKRIAAGTHWNATSALWNSATTWNQAVIAGPATDVGWSFTIVPATTATEYLVRVRATDAHGNVRTIGRTVVTG